MKPRDRDQVLQAIKKLSVELNKVHANSQTAQYLVKALNDLATTDGIAFNAAFQYFLNNAPVVRAAESLEFNKTESELWQNVMSLNHLLRNSLWSR